MRIKNKINFAFLIVLFGKFRTHQAYAQIGGGANLNYSENTVGCFNDKAAVTATFESTPMSFYPLSPSFNWSNGATLKIYQTFLLGIVPLQLHM